MYDLQELLLQRGSALDERRRIKDEHARLAVKLAEVNERLANVVVAIAEIERDTEIAVQRKGNEHFESA